MRPLRYSVAPSSWATWITESLGRPSDRSSWGCYLRRDEFDWRTPRFVKTARRPQMKTALPGPKAAELIARDARAMSPSFTRAYPFVMERGEGCWATDVDGNTFLDFTAGIAVNTTGFSHPKVVAAIEEQARRFLHMSGTDFYYRSEIELAERLEAKILPGTPAKVFFTNSGAEAIEGAMKLARYATGRPSYVAFIGGFHGRTFGALSLTASKASQRRRFAPLLSSVFHAPFPSASRGVTTDDSLARIEELFSTVAPPESVAAVFVEPIQGEGGYLVPPDDFLPRLRELTLKHGILLVADEVQCGMGRTGQLLAVEHWNVEPDIVCLAKGIASGLPLGAFIARAEQMSWPPGSHGSTFGGNPVACSAGLPPSTCSKRASWPMHQKLARSSRMDCGRSRRPTTRSPTSAASA